MKLALFLFATFSVLTMACSASNSDSSSQGAVIEPAQPAASAAPVGGKPDRGAAAAAVTPNPAASPASAAQNPAQPQAGRWIDVDVTRFRVRLMDGAQTLKTLEPVAVGAQVDTGAFESTQTGLFYVYNKIPGLQYDPPY